MIFKKLNKFNISKAVWWIAIATIVIASIIMITSGIFARPEVDDLKLQKEKTTTNIIGYTHYLSQDYSPRYSYHFVLSSFYAFANKSSAAYAYVGIVTFGVVFLSILYSMHQFFRNRLAIVHQASIAGAITLFSFLISPLYYHALYWAPGALNYPFVVALLLPIIAILSTRSKLQLKDIAALCTLLVIGLFYNEIFIPLLGIGLGIALVARIISKNKLSKEVVIFCLAAIILAAIVYVYFTHAPGTIRRLSDSEKYALHGGELLRHTFTAGTKVIFAPFTMSASLGFLIVVLAICSYVKPITTSLNTRHKLLLLGGLWLVYFAVGYLLAFIAFYSGSAEGGMPPQRVRYIETLLFVITLASSLVILSFKVYRYRLFKYTLAVAGIVTMVCTTNSLLGTMNTYAFNASLFDMRGAYLSQKQTSDGSDLSLPCVRYDALPDYSDAKWIEVAFIDYYGLKAQKLPQCLSQPIYEIK